MNENTHCHHLRIWKNALFVLSLALIVTSGCGYPEVSPQSYGLTKALYAICNRADERRLAEFEQRLSQELEAGRISDSEVAMFESIIQMAEGGDWKSAMQECRQVMVDHVDR
ncbi:hypothetical protein KOR42_38690 [Thalassoglobus neptunius]|uniref:Uncharacterized protein n=1 Tax=Thalassoglobus neptunius TaxID=1938619 RepID=A0A5C5WGX7_9PLAN|nr:hypothetical protein [Thalassoglobus neptunius]TWT49797.1 hypothetical protein KOR42_38690 [Thalassoglobus neptunius]